MDIMEKMSSKKRLIDADALWRKFESELWYDNADRDEIALPLVDEAPTVDSVEVVRCRECKQGEIDDPDFPDEYYCHEGCGWNKGDFYCAYGERKEGADNG